MHTVYVDPRLTDAQRLERLYDGQLFAFTPRRTTQALCDFAREMIVEAFAPHDPVEAQYHMPVEEWVARFGPVKPAFIHHPRTRELLRNVLVDVGCDADETYVDVPRLRGVTSDGYLTSGVGYAHHPHRDTWYSAPMAQLNWWLPIFPFDTESSMAFHPRYWSEGVRNGSAEFDYYEWNAVGRKDASKHITSDTRKQPKAEERVELDPQVRVVCDVGGIVLFSGAQMHSTVPNTSGRARFSIDFRTVNLADLRAGRGAANVDSAPRGTSLRDFVRCSDLAPMPEDVVRRYDRGYEGGERSDRVLVYEPEAVGAES
ncbi:MAG: phytanoyl-CoA dioxygenase family protein [Acidimicrobiales bacterium]